MTEEGGRPSTIAVAVTWWTSWNTADRSPSKRAHSWAYQNAATPPGRSAARTVQRPVDAYSRAFSPRTSHSGPLSVSRATTSHIPRAPSMRSATSAARRRARPARSASAARRAAAPPCLRNQAITAGSSSATVTKATRGHPSASSNASPMPSPPMRTSRESPATRGQAAPTSALLLAALAAETRKTPLATISRPAGPRRSASSPLTPRTRSISSLNAIGGPLYAALVHTAAHRVRAQDRLRR